VQKQDFKMNRITQEEAKQYIPCSEDYSNNPPSYFTLTERGDGWDEITYYTGKKRGLFIGRDGDEWVYILTNPAIPGMIKIGYTRLDPFERAIQVSRGTGVPMGYEVEWAYKCYKGERIEREVHKYFKKERVSPTREFFRVTLDEAKQIIEQIGKKYV
jgi:hypothetical protein